MSKLVPLKRDFLYERERLHIERIYGIGKLVWKNISRIALFSWFQKEKPLDL
jgi:hypothetical protein